LQQRWQGRGKARSDHKFRNADHGARQVRGFPLWHPPPECLHQFDSTLKQKRLEAARNCATRRPGYAQQRPVLDEFASEFGGGMSTMLDLDKQQAVLTCWHDLFRESALS
jgi:hypothetical protein